MPQWSQERTKLAISPSEATTTFTNCEAKSRPSGAAVVDVDDSTLTRLQRRSAAELADALFK